MSQKPVCIDKRLENIDTQLECITTAVVNGFGNAEKNRQAIRDEIKQSIDIYARAVDDMPSNPKHTCMKC